jgi:chromosome segregation ATPase
MTLPIDVQRKVRQLDNDVQSIYELLAGIAATQSRHGNRFEELETKLDTVGQELEGKIDAVREELGTVRGELGTVRGELGTVRQELEAKLDTVRGELEAKLDTVIRLVGGQAG